VYFGYPVAHGDDARRAVMAGLRIVEAVRRLSASLQRGVGIELGVRVGIHSGLVVISEAPQGSEPLSVIGQAPGVASQIERAAAPNTIVISGATRHIIGAGFTCEPMDAGLRRGTAPDLELFRVTSASEDSPDQDAAELPCVGRDMEIRLLVDRWEQASGGTSQIVVITAEAGIGKSRVLRTFRRALTGQRFQWLECRCSPYFQNTAFYPLIDLLRRMAFITGTDGEPQILSKLEKALRPYALPQEVLALFASLLSALHPAHSAPLNLSPQRQRQKTHEAFLSLFHKLTANEPLCFAIEDLHWADPSTIELLGLLALQEVEASILSLMTCRPTFKPPWVGREHVCQIALSKLPRKRVEAMILQLTRGKALPPELVDQITAKTDGVPLFVEELTKMVLESSLLLDQGASYALTGPLPSLSIPSTLRDSLTARLDRLGKAKATAQLAAAIGREFSYALLRDISSRDTGALEEDLARLVEGELIYQKGFLPRATYTFKHILVQEAAYESLLKKSRQRTHQRIADALVARFPEIAETQPEVLAHHYEAAGLNVKAVHSLLRAGQSAVARSASVEAIGHFSKAIALIETLPDAPEKSYLEISLRASLGAPLMATRGYGSSEVEATYARALSLSERSELGASPELVPILWGLWIFYQVRSKLPTALELAGRLLDFAKRTSDPGDLLCAHLARGNTLLLMGKLDEACAHLEEGLSCHDSMAHRTFAFVYGQDPAVHSLVMLGWTLFMLGYPDDGLKRLDEAISMARALSHPASLGIAMGMTCTCLHIVKDPLSAEGWSEELIRLCREQGLVHWHGLGHMIHGWTRMQRGDLTGGLEEIEEGRKRWRDTGSRSGDSQWDALMIEAYLEAGRPEDSLALLKKSKAYVAETEEWLLAPELDRLEGEIALSQRDDRAAAEASFQRALEGAVREGSKLLELRAAVSLGRLWQAQGREEAAQRMLKRVLATVSQGHESRDVRQARELLERIDAD
jgi:tetratricopeptide (TPR) repeat protein